MLLLMLLLGSAMHDPLAVTHPCKAEMKCTLFKSSCPQLGSRHGSPLADKAIPVPRRRMRVAAGILLLGLACCHQKRADPKPVLSCMASQQGHDDYLLVTRCEPLGKSERIAGTWFVAFELSLFKKGRPTRDDRLTQYHQLIVPAPLNAAVHKIDATGVAAYEIVFMGRRSLVQAGPEPNIFVADKIISMRRIEANLPPVR